MEIKEIIHHPDGRVETLEENQHGAKSTLIEYPDGRSKSISVQPDGFRSEYESKNHRPHGYTRSFFANGQKRWEVPYVDGSAEGTERQWDETGRLVEERCFHFGALHGPWRTWPEPGREELKGDYVFGLHKEDVERARNPDFMRSVRPFLEREPDGAVVDDYLQASAKDTVVLGEGVTENPNLTDRLSFIGHVNVLGRGEDWPVFEGKQLSPVLQLDCQALPLAGYLKDHLSFLTLFALPDRICQALGQDLVLRTYSKDQPLETVTPPEVEALGPPYEISFSAHQVLHPHEYDTPNHLLWYMKAHWQDYPQLYKPSPRGGEWDQRAEGVSHVGGWPGWLRKGTIMPQDTFLLELRSLDLEDWECGGLATHYFFVDHQTDTFSWCVHYYEDWEPAGIP